MPPYSTGYLMPSKPKSPIFLNNSCAGNCPSASHCAMWGLISLATNLRTVSAICSCSGVNIIRTSQLNKQFEISNVPRCCHCERSAAIQDFMDRHAALAMPKRDGSWKVEGTVAIFISSTCVQHQKYWGAKCDSALLPPGPD